LAIHAVDQTRRQGWQLATSRPQVAHRHDGGYFAHHSRSTFSPLAGSGIARFACIGGNAVTLIDKQAEHYRKAASILVTGNP
jgi:hypothetical protein